MKANVKKETKLVIPEIVLSIGMIVKNEEKHLDNCLRALKKLMDQITCELIIVDTGSTDRTKEIAYKYTDKVYDFEWIGDFAAARNYGLEKAKGMWFMFLDADEYLDEDCSEMVSFFNMPELYNRYETASYIIRNYTDSNMIDSRDFLGSRLIKLSPNVKFEGTIHEYLPFKLPHGYFSTVFHHYGYLNDDPDYINKKRKRNFPLIMEEYKKNPKNLRTVEQVIATYDDMEKKLEYIEKGMNYVDLTENMYYTNGFLITSIRNYVLAKKYDEAKKVYDKFFSINGNDKTVAVFSIYLSMLKLYLDIEDYAEAAKCLKKYLKAYDMYKKGELDVFDLRMAVIDGCTEREHERNILRYADCLCKLKKFDEAHECIKDFDLDKMKLTEFRMYLANYRELFRQSKNYKDAALLYCKVDKLGDSDKTGLVLFMIQEYYMQHQYEQKEFVKDVIESGADGKYIDLMRLVSEQNESSEFATKLKEFIDSVDNWKDGYSEAIYLAMKYDVDISNVIAKLGHDDLKSHFPIIAEGHNDYSEVALKYCHIEKFSDSIKKMLWMVSALETAVLSSQRLMNSQREELYDRFIAVLSDYVMNIYNPDLLNAEDVEVLPQLHRFGYYMTMAFVARENNEHIAYIRLLKEALRLCEPMKDLVSFYLKQFEKEIND